MYKLFFESFCRQVIDTKIIKLKKVYCPSYFTEYFIKIVKRVENLDASNYKSCRLKKRLINCDLVFYQPFYRSQSEFVFYEDIGAVVLNKEIDELDSQNSQESGLSDNNETESEQENDLFNVSYSAFHQVCMKIKESLKMWNWG
nr:uncharacterized protein LOC124810325 [Hydra vulgaris]